MAYDDRNDPGYDRPGRYRERNRDEQQRSERGGQPERLGQRNVRGEQDDPDYGSVRYGAGQEGFSTGGMNSDPDSFFGAPGYDASFGGPRFDRQDVGSTGTHGVHPVSSPFGGGQSGSGISASGGYSSSARRYAQIQQSESGSGQGDDRMRRASGGQRQFDPHYHSWRERQIQSLDQDYQDYCREHQSRFEQEFSSFRERRGQQRASVGRVTEHMDVVGSDGQHVGTVDKTRDDQIVLTRTDSDAGGRHHHIPCSWIETVDDKVRLNLDAAEAKRRWTAEDQGGALFDRDRDRDRHGGSMGGDGPHILNRSFAGTYDDDGEKGRGRS